MVSVKDATVDQIIKDITTEDDPDSWLTVGVNHHGQFVVAGVDGSGEVWADTLKDALIKYFVDWLEIGGYLADIDDILQYQNLDWSPVLNTDL